MGLGLLSIPFIWGEIQYRSLSPIEKVNVTGTVLSEKERYRPIGLASPIHEYHLGVSTEYGRTRVVVTNSTEPVLHLRFPPRITIPGNKKIEDLEPFIDKGTKIVISNVPKVYLSNEVLYVNANQIQISQE